MMTGVVDDKGRVLLRIRIAHPTTSIETEIDAWIDTGFTGELVMPMTQIATMGLPLGPTIKAVLGDGTETQLETNTCLIAWFGETKRIEVVANQGRFPLLGYDC
jgi:predicted aspartyl protease